MNSQSDPPGVTTELAGRMALKFVVLLGIVSLFADMTYEGARSITGPYLGVLARAGWSWAWWPGWAS